MPPGGQLLAGGTLDATWWAAACWWHASAWLSTMHCYGCCALCRQWGAVAVAHSTWNSTRQRSGWVTSTLRGPHPLSQSALWEVESCSCVGACCTRANRHKQKPRPWTHAWVSPANLALVVSLHSWQLTTPQKPCSCGAAVWLSCGNIVRLQWQVWLRS
jgi:hypothetical protein